MTGSVAGGYGAEQEGAGYGRSPDSARLDLPRLLDQATRILDSVVEQFVAGLGSPSAVRKGPHDFATQVDLDLERRIGQMIEQETQLPLHGEEFGGEPFDTGTTWVLDPIDGTFNYSVGMPNTCILLALLSDGQPLIGLTWMPLIDKRFAAHAGGPLLLDGAPAEPLARRRLKDSTIGYGAFDAGAGGRYPGARRVDLLRELSKRIARMRINGCTGMDMAYTASGALGGAVTFGRNPWDNAAGAALVTAAGGVTTDLAGAPWTANSQSLVAGAPGVHEELMAVIDEVIGPDWQAESAADTDPDNRSSSAEGAPA